MDPTQTTSNAPAPESAQTPVFPDPNVPPAPVPPPPSQPVTPLPQVPSEPLPPLTTPVAPVMDTVPPPPSLQPQEVTPMPQPMSSEPQVLVQKKQFPKKLILGIVVLVFIVGISGFVILKKDTLLPNPNASPTPLTVVNPNNSALLSLPSDIDSGEIAFVSEGEVKILDTRTGETKTIDTAEAENQIEFTPIVPRWFTQIEFSPSGNYLFFNSTEAFYIYDVKKDTVLVNNQLGASPHIYEISQDEKLAIIDSGEGPGARGRDVIQLSDATKILDQTGFRGFWLGKQSSFVLAMEELKLEIPLMEAPITTTSVVKIDEGGMKRELVKGTSQTSFEPVKILSDSEILVKKNQYKRPFPKILTEIELSDSAVQSSWVDNYETPQVTYWIYNLVTEKLSTTKKPDTEDSWPPKYRNDLSPSGTWTVFVEPVEGYKKIFVSKTDGTRRQQITDGDEAVWRPQSSE